jgi:hypothetical protein
VKDVSERCEASPFPDGQSSASRRYRRGPAVGPWPAGPYVSDAHAWPAGAKKRGSRAGVGGWSVAPAGVAVSI